MRISVFDVFKVGIGPSSSHTVGPMKAAQRFLETLKAKDLLANGKVKSVQADLYGSLALTGKGHCTDVAIILGLMGFAPDNIDTQMVPNYLADIEKSKKLNLGGKLEIPFQKSNIVFKKTQRLEYHTNGMELIAFDDSGAELFKERYYSIGGGFILSDAETKDSQKKSQQQSFPFEFCTAKELIDMCQSHHFDIPTLMRQNEYTLRSEQQVKDGLDKIWQVMERCIQNGLKNEGELPGGLKLKRRAPGFYRKMVEGIPGPFDANKWLSVYAMAVNEENANGGQVVTAPTNGASGIIPAVLKYYDQFLSEKNPNKHHDFLLTAAAIGILFKKGATISGAEGGCQAEVGVACSMAAAGLTQIMGGSIYQVENAAEIGIEHNLGLTCDPIDGLVQIPCIERNTMGAVKAVNASSLALEGDGSHYVSLDSAIKTMKDIGNDMKKKYKETSLGGLAKTVKEEKVLEADPALTANSQGAQKKRSDQKQTDKIHVTKRDHYMPEC